MIKETYYHGTIRIKKASTLQSWIDKGWYQQQIDNGYTFATGCGRFVIGQCICRRCKRPNGALEFKKIIEKIKT